MTKEGAYLNSIGFIPHQFINREWVPVPDEPSYSSMSGIPGKSYLMCLWKKGDKTAMTGLSERGHPPCLIYPRPLLAARHADRTMIISPDDKDMDRIIAKCGIEETLRMGWANEICETRP